MTDFVVHSEKVQSTPQGNKIDADQRYLRSIYKYYSKSSIKFKQRKTDNWYKEHNKNQNAFTCKQ